MGATLKLTPYAHQALSLAEMRELGRRAVDLHCRLSVGQSGRAWTIRVTSWANVSVPPYGSVHRLDRHHLSGHLADLMHAALDEYERAFVWTPDELATIYRQTTVVPA